jgi:hypothetical protein
MLVEESRVILIGGGLDVTVGWHFNPDYGWNWLARKSPNLLFTEKYNSA